MWSFGALCDEFAVSTRLYLKLDLNPSRETILHFFDRVRQACPRLTRLRAREGGSLILDDGGEEPHGRRFVRLDGNAIRFGLSGAPQLDALHQYAELILGQAPYHLSLSELDYDYMDVIFAFELEYRGNHDELIAETLLPDHPLVRALTDDEQRIIDFQPFFGVSLSPGCERQAFVEVKGRTSTYELRTGEYEAAPLCVRLVLRRYWGFGELPTAIDVHRELLTQGAQYAEERVVPHVIKPLAAAIASRR
jgi:hypothetical protein